MAENLFSTILGVHKEIYSPDYYQLLLLNPEETNPELVEIQYKIQMSRVQNVKSTKYKDFVEFLKGELKQARRILNESKLRARYDLEREKEASEKLSDIIEMFIQISGNMSEIEIRETHRRGKYLNLSKKTIDKIIDDELKSFGCKRIRASQQQLQRASEIMQKRVGKGNLSDTALIQKSSSTSMHSVFPAGKQDRRTSDRRKGGRRKQDLKKQEDLAKDADRLQKLARRKKKLKPIFKFLKATNIFFSFLNWLVILGLLGVIFLFNDTPVVQDNVSKIFNIKPKIEIKKVPNVSNATDDLTNNNPEENPISAPNPSINENPPKKDFDTTLEEIQQIVYTQSDSVFNNIAQARIKLLDYYDELSSKIKIESSQGEDIADLTKKQGQVLDFYRKIISPLYYSTRKKWEWQMFTKPIDFINCNIEYTDLGAIIQSENKEFCWSFGGSFLTGRIIIDGSINEENMGNFGLEFYKGTKNVSAQLIVDPVLKLLKFNANYEELNHQPQNINKIKQFSDKDSIKDFHLEIIVRTLSQARNKIEFQNTFTSIYNSEEKKINVLWAELPFLCEKGNRLTLFVTKNSKLNINKILVEPYN